MIKRVMFYLSNGYDFGKLKIVYVKWEKKIFLIKGNIVYIL